MSFSNENMVIERKKERRKEGRKEGKRKTIMEDFFLALQNTF